MEYYDLDETYKEYEEYKYKEYQGKCLKNFSGGGGKCPGGICPKGVIVRGGICPGVIVRGVIVRGVIVLIPIDNQQICQDTWNVDRECHRVSKESSRLFKALGKLANIAWQTILSVSASLAMDKKVSPDLR